MPKSTPAHLPADSEVVDAVLLHVNDWDLQDRHLKRGLTTCSLICRHWVTAIRPLLFEELTLQTAEDISQLLEFLDYPNFLDRPSRRCLRKINIVNSQKQKQCPWMHQILKLRGKSVVLNVSLTSANAAAPETQLKPTETNHTLTLPFAWLPRALPVSRGFLQRLTLSGIRLPSTRVLVDSIARLRVVELTLDGVSLVKREIEVPRARLVRPTPDFYLTVSRNFPNPADDLPRWFRIANLLFTGQGHTPLNHAAWELTDQHVPLLLSFMPKHASLQHLNVRKIGGIDVSRKGYTYDLHMQKQVFAGLSVSIHEDDPLHAEIAHLRFNCPAIAPAEMPPYFENIEKTVTELNGTNPPSLVIVCLTQYQASVVLELLRAGAIFPRLHGLQRRVHVEAPTIRGEGRSEFLAGQIVALYHRLVLDGACVVLDESSASDGPPTARATANGAPARGSWWRKHAQREALWA